MDGWMVEKKIELIFVDFVERYLEKMKIEEKKFQNKDRFFCFFTFFYFFDFFINQVSSFDIWEGIHVILKCHNRSITSNWSSLVKTK